MFRKCCFLRIFNSVQYTLISCSLPSGPSVHQILLSLLLQLIDSTYGSRILFRRRYHCDSNAGVKSNFRLGHGHGFSTNDGCNECRTIVFYAFGDIWRRKDPFYCLRNWKVFGARLNEFPLPPLLSKLNRWTVKKGSQQRLRMNFERS